MKKIFIFLLAVVAAGCLLLPLRAQQDQRMIPLRDHPFVYLPIDPRYFPENEYDYSKFDGMIIPDGNEPICLPQNEVAGGGWVQGDVDYESKAVGCRMPGLVKHVDASKTRGHSDSVPKKRVQASNVQQSGYKIWAVNSPDCRYTPNPCTSPNQGMYRLYFSLSARKPSMNSGVPGDILYAVRVHAGGRVDGSHIQCSDPNVTDPNLVLGAGWGATETGPISGDMKLVYERWDEEDCTTQVVTNYTIPQTLAVYTKLYRYSNDGNTNSAQWRQQIWWNNAWTTVSTLWTTFEEIVWIESGVEYDPLTDNNYSKANIPYNFVGNISYKTTAMDNAGYTQDNYPFDSTFALFSPDWSNKYDYYIYPPLDSESSTHNPNDQSSVYAHID